MSKPNPPTTQKPTVPREPPHSPPLPGVNSKADQLIRRVIEVQKKYPLPKSSGPTFSSR